MRPSYTQALWSRLTAPTYGDAEWRCLQLYLAGWSYAYMVDFLYRYHTLAYPSGVLALCDTSWLLLPAVRLGIAVVLAVLMLLYILQVRMALVTGAIAALSVVILTIGEANGVMGRNGLISLVWLAQCLAYVLYRRGTVADVRQARFQLPLQAVAAVYTLAALAKLYPSALQWLADAPYMSLQVTKSFDYAWYTTGDMALHQMGLRRAAWLAAHPVLVRALLACSLLMETCAVVLLMGRRPALVYGLLLLCMHIGISYCMDIFFPSISVPMLAFAVNPVYLLAIPLLAWRDRRNV